MRPSTAADLARSNKYAGREAAYLREWYAAHPGKMAGYLETYKAKNGDSKIKASRAQWAAKHPLEQRHAAAYLGRRDAS